MAAVILNLDTVNLTDEQFYCLCQVNPDWQLERNAQGELIVMPPVGGISGNREADFISLLWLWNRQTGLGKVFSSATIFRLPKGGDRAPDAAWVSLTRWQALSREEQEKFPPIYSLPEIQAKMQEYLHSGLRLGWLVNPQQQQVEIYRPQQPVEIMELPANLSGEDVLPGFSLFISIFE